MTDSNMISLKSSRICVLNASIKARGQEAGEPVIRSQYTARSTCPGLNQRITEVQPW